MYVLITFLLLFLSTLGMIGLRLWRRSASYSWLVATGGAFFAWVSILAWQLKIPQRYSPSVWSPDTLFTTSPVFSVTQYSWLFALTLAAVAVAVLMTSPARTSIEVNPAAWAGTLAISAVAILAVLADNPLALVMVWSALDLAEFINTLRASDTPNLSQRTVVSFFIRSAGTGMALFASVISAASGQQFLFENVQPGSGIFLLAAAGLRLGVLPLHLTFRSEPVLRRGFGTTLRLAAAASSLILLARVPASAIDPGLVLPLMTLVSVAAFYSAWKWLTASDSISGRPYWIIGMSSMAVAALLRGNPDGSAAWGLAMMLFGTISFLYSARSPAISRLLAASAVLMLGLPFTLTGSGWAGAFPLAFVFLPIFMLSHLMLVTGFIVQVLKDGEINFLELPAWARASYPFGLLLLLATAVLGGVWGWSGALRLDGLIASLVLLILLGGMGFAAWRVGFFRETGPRLPTGMSISSHLANAQDMIVRFVLLAFDWLGVTFEYGSGLLEGDGGLLWTLLLMVLLISILRG